MCGRDCIKFQSLESSCKPKLKKSKQVKQILQANLQPWRIKNLRSKQ